MTELLFVSKYMLDTPEFQQSSFLTEQTLQTYKNIQDMKQYIVASYFRIS